MKSVAPLLAEIGLSDGEQKVYLTLLDLGESTSGPIAEASGVSASKVYQVTDRLKKKGLIGESIIKGTKHFKAEDPQALLNYLERKKQRISALEKEADAVLPALRARHAETAKKTEVQLFQGVQSIRNAFYGMIDSMKKGEEYCVIGGTLGDTSWAGPFFSQYHRERARKGIRAKILFQGKQNMKTDGRGIEGRCLPPNLKNPLQITLCKDTTLLQVHTEAPLLLRVTNAEIAASFRQYFQALWNQDAQTWSGNEALSAVVDDVLSANADLYLIGAHGYMPNRYPAEFRRLVHGISKNGKKRFHLSRERTRGTSFNEGAETHYLPESLLSPTVIWVYGDVVVHAIWEDTLTVFRIQNAKIAEDYRTYFSFLSTFSKKA